MVKLLLCLFCAFAIGVAMLELRQQELELKHRAAKFQEEIEGQQAKLWGQQLQIAIYTAPNAIAKTIGQHALELVPESNAGVEEATGEKTGTAERDGGGF
jgi:hypothetical protein